MKKSRVSDHSGDLALKFEGKNLSSLLADGTVAFMDAMGMPKSTSITTQDIEVRAFDLEDLVVSYLNELILLFETKYFIAKNANVNVVEINSHQEKWFASGTLHGWIIDNNYDPKVIPKAATCHELNVNKSCGIWSVKVILDL